MYLQLVATSKFAMPFWTPNIIYGTASDDRIRTTDDGDIVYAGDGDDIIMGSEGGDAIHGGDGNDTVMYNRSDHAVVVNLEAGVGARGVTGGGDAFGDTYTSIENAVGSRFSDRLYGNDGDNMLAGGAGNDQLSGGAGNDFLMGEDGDDYIWGDADNDILIGGAGADELNGGDGVDLVAYISSADIIEMLMFQDEKKSKHMIDGVSVNLTTGRGEGGDAAGDLFRQVEDVSGTFGDDTLIGDSNDNALYGSVGADVINGMGGDDDLYGDAMAGVDDFFEMFDNVAFEGENDSDTFVFINERIPGPNNDVSHGNDTIHDFDVDADIIDLSQTEVRNFGDLFNRGDRYMEDDGFGNTVIYTIDGDDGDSITLLGVAMNTLTEDNFLF
ncbi:MAG: calcium-binding protein [Pseudomonadota bacterium]